jgi:micrococcal nuclease
MYDYGCTVTRVIDGDTVEAEVDLGFHLQQRMTIRLLGINAPEMTGPTKEQGQAAKTHLAALMGSKRLTLHTLLDKTEKYGRVLGTFYDGLTDLNQQMVADGFAVPYWPT